MLIFTSSRSMSRVHLLKSTARKFDADIYDVQLKDGFTFYKYITFRYLLVKALF